MKLSIVIVNWNTREMLRACLDSVFRNTGDFDCETIVIDNASDDGSPEMVEKDFPEVVLIRNETNRGFAAANNQGFEVARGEYVLLLNSDTIVHDDVLQKSCAYLDRNSDVGVMGCKVLNSDGSVQVACHNYPSLMNLIILTSGLWKLPGMKMFDGYLMTYWQRDTEEAVDTIAGCYMLVRRKAMDEVGVLDESFFFFGEETDWCLRFRKAGWKVRFAPVGEITHYGGGSVKKLNYKRDLMLNNATVRLHRKHGGLIAGVAVWFVLLVFNVTRAFYWLLRTLFSADQHALDRRNMFWSILRHYNRTWPTDRSQAF